MSTPQQGQPKHGAAWKGAGLAAVLVVATPLAVKWEGVKTATYLDPIGIPTACVGQTGPHIRMGQSFTRQECFAMLDATQRAKAAELDRCITAELAPHEAAAVLDLAFNVGTGAVCRSTMVRLINQGRPARVWCHELDKWVFAGGIRWQGLVNRRADAKRVCLGGSL